MAKEFSIVSVSVWDSIRIHFLSCMYGLWVLVKKIVKHFCSSFDPAIIIQQRDNPPLCLVDSSLGQHKYVKLKSVKLHYVVSGDKTHPLILLLHGFPDCWFSWRHQILLLAEEGYRVVALDLKGFGDSDKPEKRSSYKIDIILEEIKQFIVALGVSDCILIGHDLGALLGWYLVHQTPSLVKKFFAISCPHPNIFWSSSSHQWLNYAQIPYLPEIDALKHDVKIISQYHKHLLKNDTYLEAYKYSFSRTEDWTGPINYYRNLSFNKISENSEEIMSVPTILITGNHDKFVNLEGIVRSTDFCDKSYVKIVDGAGHFPHQENPEAFNEILFKFLRKSSKHLNMSPSKSLMNKMFGAVTSTVKYGNSMLDSVQKRSNGMSPINLLNYKYLNSDKSNISTNY